MATESQTGELDILIIGGGPAGLAAGAEAARLGVSHLVVERGTPPPDQPDFVTAPDTISHYQIGKFVMAEPPDLPIQPESTIRIEEGLRESVLQGWEKASRAVGTKLRTGVEVMKVDTSTRPYAATLSDGSTVVARNVIVAVGQSNLRKLPVPVADQSLVCYQLDDPKRHTKKVIVVVGVGDAGLENAKGLCAPELNNKVHLVNRGDDFPVAKPRNQEDIRQLIKTGQIEHWIKTEVVELKPGRIVVKSPKGVISIEAQMVIARIGALPPTPFLNAMGVKSMELSEQYESCVPGVFLVGAVISGTMLIKHAINAGFEVVRYIAGKAVKPADEPKLFGMFEKARLVEGLPKDEAVSRNLDRIRERLPLFAAMTRPDMRSVVARGRMLRPKDREEVVKRSTWGDALYSIVEGEVTVSVPISAAARDAVYDNADVGKERQFVLKAGQFFGEMTLLSDGLHAGTVSAKGDGCIIVESPRMAILEQMKRQEGVRRIIEETFVVRKLGNLAAGVAEADVRALAATAQRRSYKAQEVLFNEGDEPDGLHVIRRGSVTVSRKRGNGDIVLAYVPAGNMTGEMALLSPKLRRSATVRATVDTETICVPMDAIVPFIEQHESVQKMVKKTASDRLAQNAVRIDSQASDLVNFLMQAGAGEATNILLIDEALCVRCNNCEHACADTHDGVSRLDREAGPTFATVHIPTTCRHCENPKCMTNCPTDAIHRHANGEVYITDSCIGCEQCAQACPYHVIQMAYVEKPSAMDKMFSLPKKALGVLFGLGGRNHGDHHDPKAKKKATKCDLCGSEKLRRELHGRAACELSCPTGAIIRVDPADYLQHVMPKTGAPGIDG